MRTMMAKLMMTTVRPLPTSTGESVMDTSSAGAQALRDDNALTVGDFEKKNTCDRLTEIYVVFVFWVLFCVFKFFGYSIELPTDIIFFFNSFRIPFFHSSAILFVFLLPTSF